MKNRGVVLGVCVGVALGFAVSYAPLVEAARNASGTFSLVSGNPVVTGTTITSTWANNTLSDIGTELTDSLNRSGKGAMLAGLKGYNGTEALPGFSFASDTDCGLYRVGTNSVGMSISGALSQSWTTTGVNITATPLNTNFGLVATHGNNGAVAIDATGNEAAGVKGTGGAASAGIWGIGGSTSGNGGLFTGTGSGSGVRATGGATNGVGVSGIGTGTGQGGAFSCDSAVAGTNCNGLSSVAGGTGFGVLGTAGSGAAGYGVKGVAGAGSAGAGVTGVTGGTSNSAAVRGESTHLDVPAVYAFANAATGTPGNTGAALVASGTQAGASSGSYAAWLGTDTSSPARAPLHMECQDTNPTTAQAGDVYCNSGTVKPYMHNGTTWYQFHWGPTGSATLDFADPGAGLCTNAQSVTVTGAADQDGCVVSAPAAIAATDACLFRCHISSANTASVRMCNISAAGTCEPASASYKVFAIK